MNKKEKDIPLQDTSLHSENEPMTKEQYWKKNISCVLILLSVWFIVSYGCGILFVETLNQIKLEVLVLGSGWLSKVLSMSLLLLFLFMCVS